MNLRRYYNTKFLTEYKTKLNQLYQIEGLTQKFNVLFITFRNTTTRDHNFLVRFCIVMQRGCRCLATKKMTIILSFCPLQTSLKLATKCDVKF